MVGSAVIVVDDNHRALRALTGMIGRLGVATVPCSTFGDAEAALKTFPDSRLGLVADYVLDHGKNGLALAEQARSRFGDGVYIALATGYDIEVSSHGKDAFDRFINKPVSREQLESFVVELDFRRFGSSPLIRETLLALAKQFALSVPETRIMTAIAVGSRRAQLANIIGISDNTLKSQIRGLLHKTSTTDIVQLASLLLREMNCRGGV